MQGRDRGNVPEEVSFISTQLSGRYEPKPQYRLDFSIRSSWKSDPYHT